MGLSKANMKHYIFYIYKKNKMHVYFSLLTLCTVFLFIWSDNSFADEIMNKQDPEILSDILSMPNNTGYADMFFSDNDPDKTKIIRNVLSVYGLNEKMFVYPGTNEIIKIFSISKPLNNTWIEFRKINLTKYRIRIHHARESFPIILSESYDDGWKAYLVNFKTTMDRSLSNAILLKYKILENNEDDQASIGELKEFINKGLVTQIGDGTLKVKYHYKYLENKHQIPDHAEKYTIDFISKEFHGSIQNNNLHSDSFMETWFSSKLLMTNGAVKDGLNKRVVQWPDVLHWHVNGYANSWWIDMDMLRKLPQASLNSPGFYKVNADGSIDFEIVVEFWPQRLFYIGAFISVTTFICCIIYLVYDWRKRKFMKKSKFITEPS